MKNILFGSIFLLLTACSSGFSINTQESICLQLPSWPPEDPLSESYPPLCYWKIEYYSPRTKSSYTTVSSSICLTVDKNIPLFLTATPITKKSDTEKANLFCPAGFIYPSKSDISWEQGFIAQCGQKIIKSQLETGISSSRLEQFISSFNWKKAQETVEKKIYKEDIITNPWFIDSKKFITDLCYGDFSASSLNISSCYIFDLQEIFTSATPLSTFIPENKSISDVQKVKLQKDYNNFFIINNNIGATISVKSGKNASIQYVYLPIYIEDI